MAKLPTALRSLAGPSSKPPTQKILVQFDSDVVTSLPYSNAPPRPAVFTGERIAGRITVDGTVDFDGVLVTLKGNVQNIIKHAQQPAKKLRKELLCLSQVLEHSSFRPTAQRQSRAESEFYFNIPHIVALPESGKCVRNQSHSLPPTVHVRKNRDLNRVCNDDIEGSSCVTYSITAQLLLDGSPIGSLSVEREIVVLPASDVPPPAFTKETGSGLAESYTASQQEFRCSSGAKAKLQIAIPEPKPFLMLPSDLRSVSSTELRLRLVVEGADAIDAPDVRECKINMSLEAQTMFTTAEQRANATDVVKVRDVVSVEKRKLALSGWELKSTSGNLASWQTEACVTVLAPEKLQSLPSFSCGILLRRFVYLLDIKLFDTTGRAVGKKFEHKVQVQVVLQGSTPLDMLQSYQDQDEELPGYVIRA